MFHLSESQKAGLDATRYTSLYLNESSLWSYLFIECEVSGQVINLDRDYLRGIQRLCVS